MKREIIITIIIALTALILGITAIRTWKHVELARIIFEYGKGQHCVLDSHLRIDCK